MANHENIETKPASTNCTTAVRVDQELKLSDTHLVPNSDKEIESDEQPLQGYYPLEVLAA